MSSRRSHPARPDFDRLDNRLLPAATVTATLYRGVLMVQGTDAADVIEVDVLRSNPNGRGRAALRGFVQVEGFRRVALSRIRQIVVDGGAGNDVIDVHDNGRVPLPVQISGGAGVNRINGVYDHDTAAQSITPPVVTVPTPTPTPTPQPTPTPTPTPTAPSPTPPSLNPPPTGSVAGLNSIAQHILDQVNINRADAGLAPVKLGAKLMQMAQIHADDMARLDRMEHDLSGAALPTLQSRADFVGYKFGWLGENIAFNYGTPDSVMGGWMSSPGHRANILDPRFTEMGIAVTYNAQGEPYWCQVFGQPQTS